MTEQYEEYEEDVGLTPEDRKHAKSGQLDWFKSGQKGAKYRIALTYFHPIEVSVLRALKGKSKEEVQEGIKKALAKRATDLGKSADELQDYEKLDTGNVRFKKILAHYKDGFGYAISRLGQDGPEADAIWKMLGDVKTYFTTTMLIYPVNRAGEVIKEQLSDLDNYQIVPWRFSSKIFETLLQRADSLRENQLSIASQDLWLTCTNPDFQQFDIDVAGPSIWLKSPKFASRVLGKTYPLYEKLVPFREMSTADLKIKLGLSGPVGSDEGVDDDFKELMDQV